jgi:hypothetical protein
VAFTSGCKPVEKPQSIGEKLASKKINLIEIFADWEWQIEVKVKFNTQLAP